MAKNKPKPNRHVVIIGLGGIGSWLLAGLAPYLAFGDDPERWELILVDGDDYEDKNRSRQTFSEWGNKADVQAQDVTDRFPMLSVIAVPFYMASQEKLDAKGKTVAVAIQDVLCEGDVCFLCVDNHATRKAVFEYAATLDDVDVYSGGNDVTDGAVQLYVREGGKDLTPSPLSYHPEIGAGKDKAPHEMSCDELALAGTPQVIFANMQAAVTMLSLFHSRQEGKAKLKFPEVYFDILQAAASPTERFFPETAPSLVAPPAEEEAAVLAP